MNFVCVLILSGAAFAGLTGCAVTSTLVGDDMKLPAEWKNAGNFPVASPDRDLSRWWAHFNDPTLNHLIAGVLEDNPDAQTAVSRVRESRANRAVQRAALFPSLDGGVSGNARRSRTDSAGTTSSDAYSARLDASWEVDIFGSNRSAVEAATASLGAASEELNSVHASLAAEVAATYTSLRANEARRKAASNLPAQVCRRSNRPLAREKTTWRCSLGRHREPWTHGWPAATAFRSRRRASP